jgi:hypothetical protein
MTRSWIDVAKSPSHQISQTEIASDNPCSRQLSERYAWALVELKSSRAPRVPKVTVSEAHPVYYFEVVSIDCFVGFPLFAAFFST